MSRSLTLKLYSLLLADPAHPVADSWPRLGEEITRLPEKKPRSALSRFLTEVLSRPRIQVREAYTAAFVLSPKTTLNMTYHLWGDTEKRAQALSRLQEVYLAAGYEPLTGELPDHLPLMLEFLSACPDAQGVSQIWDSMAGLPEVVDRLRHKTPLYADLLQPLIGIWEQGQPAVGQPPKDAKGGTDGLGL